MMKNHRKMTVTGIDDQKQRNKAWYNFQKPTETTPDETERNPIEKTKETDLQGN